MKKLKIIKRIEHWYVISQIRKNGFWFVDIPRTSSTSIKVQLARKYGRTYAKEFIRGEKNHTKGFFRDHLTSKHMVNFLGQRVWDDLFTFTIVRNPWDRAVSFYNYLLKINKHDKPSLSFKEHIIDLKRIYKENNFAKRRLRHGCYEYISDNNEIIVDKVIRFEDREEELKEISEKIGFELSMTEHREKILGKKSYNEFYDNESRRIIEEIYAKDIEEFGYSFE